jgi:hypothetical protein
VPKVSAVAIATGLFPNPVGTSNIAVDISKIKLAWSYKYGKIDDFAKEGFKYLEKIFQIEKAIPIPSSEQVKEYVKCLCPGCSDD